MCRVSGHVVFLSLALIRPRSRAGHVHVGIRRRPSRRRSSLPTGDFGMASTKTKRRGRLKLASPELRQNCSSSCSLTGDWRLTKAVTTLPQLLVGEADHRDLEHGRVQRQAALDLDRRDVLAAGDDHVVDAAGDEQIAVWIDKAGVAGEVPAVAQRFGIGVGSAPVALEGLVAGQQRDDLAFLTGTRDLRRRSGVQPDHLDLLIDAGLAGRARLGRRVLVDGEGVDFRAAVVIDEQLGLERRRSASSTARRSSTRRQSRACGRSRRPPRRMPRHGRDRDRASAPDRDW